MYAILRQGTHQYRVTAGDIIRIEKIEADNGSTVDFEDVLMLSDGESVQIGQPRLGDAKVTAQVLRTHKEPKVIVYKFKRRKGYEKTQGHRQPFTEVKITGIFQNGKQLV